MDITKFAFLGKSVYLAVLIAFVCLGQSIAFLAFTVGSRKCEIDCPKEKLLKKIIDFIPVMGGTALTIFGVCKYCEIHTKAIIKGDVSDYLWVMVIVAILFGYFICLGLIKYKTNRLVLEKIAGKSLIVISIAWFSFCIIGKESFAKKWEWIVYITMLFLALILRFVINQLKYISVYEDNEIGDSDLPVEEYEDLIKSRQFLVDNILADIASRKGDEPFALLLDGPWGSGKTSVVRSMAKKAQKESNKADRRKLKFVYINVGYGLKPKTAFEDVSNQINKVFEEEGFCNLNNTSIEKYFEKMCKFSSIIKDEKIGEIYELFKREDKSKEELKDELNDLLDTFRSETNSKIVIVIDDLERCPKDNVMGVLALLHETFSLHNCITLLVCAYDKLYATIGKDSAILDKYIDLTYKMPLVTDRDIYEKIILKIDDKAEGKWDFITTFESNLINDNLTEPVDYIESKLRRYVDSLTNPRTAKRLWKNGVMVGEKILTITNNKNNEFDGIREDRVSAAYGLIKIIFQEIYNGIFENGLDIYKSRYEDVSEDENKAVLDALFKELNKTECEALDWMISLDENLYIGKYAGFNNKVADEWEDKDKRIIDNIDEYINYLPSDNKILDELVAWIKDNIELLTEGRFTRLRQTYFRLIDYSEDWGKVTETMLDLADEKISVLESKKSESNNPKLLEELNDWKQKRDEFINAVGRKCLAQLADYLWLLFKAYGNSIPIEANLTSINSLDSFAQFLLGINALGLDELEKYLDKKKKDDKNFIGKMMLNNPTYLNIAIYSGVIVDFFEEKIKNEQRKEISEELFSIYIDSNIIVGIIAKLDSSKRISTQKLEEKYTLMDRLRHGSINKSLEVSVEDLHNFGNYIKDNGEADITPYCSTLMKIISDKITWIEQKIKYPEISRDDFILFISAAERIYKKFKDINLKEENDSFYKYCDIPIRLEYLRRNIDKIYPKNEESETIQSTEPD
ncbi:MAG: AAA family ATPase [Pseudobutyrivibrio sp.]|uniref:P-loop NTPase fold protein n=1 Tax=Pseudobutyrivibrio sp. TaxID=2014367 RepID=UPI0025CF80DD|nr:P-loop NTPase fold protein [Pseudobutyrivibrio sp.]MBQ6463595.1 AAA family ATPase [Pseudobutyrivibrio sp.]